MERITTPELAQQFIDEQIKALQAQIGDGKVLLALSGGVDSSVVAAMLIKAVGKQLTCVHVNHGLLRKGEPEQVIEVFRNQMNANLVYVDATDRFLDKLAGVTDPEQKRKVIGGEFIRVFEEEARKLDDIRFLAQGTIYPDILESGVVKSSLSNSSLKMKSVSSVRNWACRMEWSIVSPSRAPDWVSAALAPLPVTVWKRFVSPMRSSAKSLPRTDWKERYGSISLSFPISNPPVSVMTSAPLSGRSSSVPSTPEMP